MAGRNCHRYREKGRFPSSASTFQRGHFRFAATTARIARGLGTEPRPYQGPDGGIIGVTRGGALTILSLKNPAVWRVQRHHGERC